MSKLSDLKNLWSTGHERDAVVRKNIIYSFGVKGLNILTGLLLVPLTIDFVNPTQYGIWLTLSSIVMWLSFFDVGFGNGLRNKLTEARARGEMQLARKYVSTTYFILTIIFVGFWLIFLLINQFADWSVWLNSPVEMGEELSKLALIVVIFFCLQFILKTILNITLADQKTALSGLIEMLGQFIAMLVIFVMTRLMPQGGSLLHLGFVIGLTPVVVLLISSLILFRGVFKDIRPSVKYIDLKVIKEIFGLGVQFFLIQISLIVIFQTANMVIIQILGPGFVTTYNIAYKYFFVLCMVFVVVLTPYWSAFTEAYTRNDKAWMQQTMHKLNKLWWLTLPVAVVMVLLSGWIYQLWVGDAVQVPFMLSVLMAVYAVLFNRFNMYMYPINGIGKIRLQLVVYLTLCVVYIPLAIWLTRWLGLSGVVLANILISVVNAVVSQMQFNRLIHDEAKGIWNA